MPEQEEKPVPPRERPELKDAVYLPDGSIQIEGTAILRVGGVFSVLNNKDNQDCPEYIAGQAALALGYKANEPVDYILVIKPKRQLRKESGS